MTSPHVAQIQKAEQNPSCVIQLSALHAVVWCSSCSGLRSGLCRVVTHTPFDPRRRVYSNPATLSRPGQLHPARLRAITHSRARMYCTVRRWFQGPVNRVDRSGIIMTYCTKGIARGDQTVVHRVTRSDNHLEGTTPVLPKQALRITPLFQIRSDGQIMRISVGLKQDTGQRK